MKSAITLSLSKYYQIHTEFWTPIQYWEKEIGYQFSEFHTLFKLFFSLFLLRDNSKPYFTRICKGGELFDEIIARGKFTEKDAAVLMKQIL